MFLSFSFVFHKRKRFFTGKELFFYAIACAKKEIVTITFYAFFMKIKNTPTAIGVF
jgi:hypothetical protein